MALAMTLWMMETFWCIPTEPAGAFMISPTMSPTSIGDDQYIRFELQHRLNGAGGRLLIRCQDSGSGFDVGSLPETRMRQGAGRELNGRGIPLIRQLSRALTYNKQGNCAEVVYDWESVEAGSE